MCVWMVGSGEGRREGVQDQTLSVTPHSPDFEVVCSDTFKGPKQLRTDPKAQWRDGVSGEGNSGVVTHTAPRAAVLFFNQSQRKRGSSGKCSLCLGGFAWLINSECIDART